LILIFLLNIIAAIYQVMKIVKKGSAVGISRNSFLVVGIIGIMIIINSETKHMLFVGIFDILVSIFFIRKKQENLFYNDLSFRRGSLRL
jgi:hypothetical protein